MTVRLDLPKDVEQRLLAEVKAGRHESVEEAILERLSRRDEADLLATIEPADLRADLERAWTDREDAVDGNVVFDRIAQKSATFKAQGK